MNRRVYRALFRFYRAVFRTPVWTGQLPRASTRRVLVVQHYRAGDMIVTTPLFSLLRDVLPSVEIDVLASPANAELLVGDERVARVFTNDHTWRAWLRVLPQLRARRYDVVFSGFAAEASKGLREGFVASLAAHPHTYKVSVWRPKRYQGLFTAVFRVPRSHGHAAERWLYLGQRTLGVLPQPGESGLERYPMRLPVHAGAESRAAAFVSAHQLGTFVAVNLSAAVPWREWRPDNCAAFVALALERHPDLSVVLTPAPGKADRAAEVARRVNSPRVVVAPVLPIHDLIALVARAAVVVSPNTALIHIASARGRPVVGLYSPGAPAENPLWLPVGVPYRALVSDITRGVDAIRPQDVADAFDELREEITALSAFRRSRRPGTEDRCTS